MKNILIISQNSLSLHANNGKTLSGIFSAWDINALRQLYFQDEVPESERFRFFFRVRDVDILKWFFFISKERGRVITAKERVLDHHQGKTKIYRGFINQAKKFSFLKNLIRELLYKNNRWFSPKLEFWLDEFSPEAIFLVPSVYKFPYEIALYLKYKYNIPIFTYYTDDYLANSPVTVSQDLESKYKEIALEVMHKSSGCFVIGDEMAKIYRERYKRDFAVLINPVEFKKDRPVIDYYGKDKISVVYAGGLTLGRFEALISLSKKIKTCSILLDKTIYFKICSGDIPTGKQLNLFKLCGIQFLGRLSSLEVSDLYQGADFLVHVESDLPENIGKTKLSVSTKIPECLAKGKCLIAFGPPEIASMKLIYENEIGFYINSTSPESVSVAAIVDMFSNPGLCNAISSRGYIYAEDNFSQIFVSKTLSRVINDTEC